MYDVTVSMKSVAAKEPRCLQQTGKLSGCRIFRQGKNMKIEWLDGCKISVNTDDEEVIISANREGLLSLSGQLRALAEGAPGDHIHYDAYNSLEEGSSEMIIQRVE